ncbi:MAG TPA: hypothetical protein VN822_10715 [Candidatus Acidoferrales bacterium]|nr:hypothetical protein [Candidatus Acidoferrales bacterium]
MRLIVVLILAIFVLPVYGQEKGTKTTKQTQAADDIGQRPPAPPFVVVNQQTTNQNEGRASNHPDSYLKRLFSPENLPSIGLLLAGIGGIFVAIHTLKAIRRQTNALVEGQRPIIFAKCHGDAAKTFADRDARRIELALENRGQHRARDLVYETWIEILPFPFTDFTAAATHFKCIDPITLYPGDVGFTVNVPIQRQVTDEEWAAIRSLELHVCVRIRVSYKDAFGQTIADFGYYVTPRGMAYLPKYNNTIQSDDPN